jgi:GTPase SAR1 family protein
MGVGKSCLMKRIMDNEFRDEHQVTIGVEFGSYDLKI